MSGAAGLESFVRRQRLLDRCGAARVVVLEAPSGFGKTSLAEQLLHEHPNRLALALTSGDATLGRLVARLAEAALEAGLVAAAEAATGDGEPSERLAAFRSTLLASWPRGGGLLIDDVHHLAAGAAAAAADLAVELAAEGTIRVVLAGRLVRRRPPEAIVIDDAQLAFDAQEIGEVLRGRPGAPAAALDVELPLSVARCRRSTNGWPAAVAMWSPDGDDRSFADQCARLVGTLAVERSRLLATLPLLNDEVGAVVGWPDLVHDVVAGGLPVRRFGRWWIVADVARDLLEVGSLPPESTVAVAEVYASAGAVFHAVDLLLAAGLQVELAHLVDGLQLDHLEQLDIHELSAAVTSLPDEALRAVPGALLGLALAASGRTQMDLRRRLLLRLESLQVRDPVVVRRLAVEHLYDLSRDAEMDEVERLGPALLDSLGPDEHHARSRCLYALGQTATHRGDPASLVRAGAMLAESAGIARSAGLALARAKALNTLGYSVLFARGELGAALARMEEAVSLTAPQSRLRGTLLTFVAEVLAYQGRDDDALGAAAEARAIAHRFGDTRTLAYASWCAAKVAGRRRDAAGLRAWHADVMAHRAEWFEHPTGAEFLAIASELSAGVGDEASAREWLRQALAHPAVAEYPDIAWAAAGFIEVQFGDPAAGIRILTKLLDEGWTQARSRWIYHVWIGAAHLAVGDRDAALAEATTARQAVASMGMPELLTLHTPEMWSALEAAAAAAPPADSSGSNAGLDGRSGDVLADLHADAAWTIRVLGGFVVRRDERGRVDEVAVASGKPQQLLKVLALAGQPLDDDVVIEHLWPDSDVDVGRRRLRNVIARVRATAPIVERSDGLLMLAAGVNVDAVLFEALARTALRTEGAERSNRAREALELYRGEVLPGDRYDDWAAPARERARHLAVRLWEVVAESCERSGDIEGATGAIEQLLAADPYDEVWAERAAALHEAAGQRASAKTWRDRAARIRDDLGLAAR